MFNFYIEKKNARPENGLHCAIANDNKNLILLNFQRERNKNTIRSAYKRYLHWFHFGAAIVIARTHRAVDPFTVSGIHIGRRPERFSRVSSGFEIALDEHSKNTHTMGEKNARNEIEISLINRHQTLWYITARCVVIGECRMWEDIFYENF